MSDQGQGLEVPESVTVRAWGRGRRQCPWGGGSRRGPKYGSRRGCSGGDSRTRSWGITRVSFKPKDTWNQWVIINGQKDT